MRAMLLVLLLSAPVVRAAEPSPLNTDDSIRKLELAGAEFAARVMETMLPMMQQMLTIAAEKARDLPRFEKPEVQPNGDILIRRRAPQPPAEDL